MGSEQRGVVVARELMAWRDEAAARLSGMRGWRLFSAAMRWRPALEQHAASAISAEPVDDAPAATASVATAPGGAFRGAFAGTRRARMFWQIATIALCRRVALLPLGHPWDTVTFYNMFIEWGHGQSPYSSLRTLSDIARAAGWGSAYEGFAYPPGALYLYYPLARLFVWLHPHLVAHYPVEGRLALPTLPLDFYLWLKLPFWLGDLGIAWLLARMTGSVRATRAYLLNPYVLLVSGCWTFDSVMVFALLLAAYLVQRERVGWSAAALAAGTMIKFVPGFVFPVFLLYLIARARPARRVALFAGVYAGVCLALLAPFTGDFLDVLAFEGARTGFGMHWEMILVVSQILPTGVDWHAINVAAGTFSLGALVIALLLAYRYVFQREVPLTRAVLFTLLVYLLASKLVNEQYVLALLPFSYLELHAARGQRTGWRWFHRLLWLTPLAFAAMNVPLDRFLLPFYHTLFGTAASVITANGGTALASPYLPWYREPLRWIALDVLAVWFMLLVACALVWLARHPAALARVALASGVASPGALAENGASEGHRGHARWHEPRWKPLPGRATNRTKTPEALRSPTTGDG